MFVPTGGRILVEPKKKNQIEAEGILLIKKETHLEDKMLAYVISVDNSVRQEVKPGDLIVCQQYKGTYFKMGKRTFKILDQDDVEAIIS